MLNTDFATISKIIEILKETCVSFQFCKPHGPHALSHTDIMKAEHEYTLPIRAKMAQHGPCETNKASILLFNVFYDSYRFQYQLYYTMIWGGWQHIDKAAC